MKIQLGDKESEIDHEPKPIEFSTPLKQKKLTRFMINKRVTF